jgi:hypothetical protein
MGATGYSIGRASGLDTCPSDISVASNMAAAGSRRGGAQVQTLRRRRGRAGPCAGCLLAMQLAASFVSRLPARSLGVFVGRGW